MLKSYFSHCLGWNWSETCSYFLVTVWIIPISRCSYIWRKQAFRICASRFYEYKYYSTGLLYLWTNFTVGSVLLVFSLGWGGFWDVPGIKALELKKKKKIVACLGPMCAKMAFVLTRACTQLLQGKQLHHGFPVFEKCFSILYAVIYQNAKYCYFESPFLLGVIHTSWVECYAHYHL